MEFKVGDKVIHETLGIVEILRYETIPDVFIVKDNFDFEWYVSTEYLSCIKELEISNECTCGAHSLGHPGHSTWCDSLNEVA